ncbi:MAG: glycosyltransferase family 39 protein [Bacteroidales bacterium]|nr:glycosyltransferase family 39 protein [Bacteroidales bacterium]
MKKIKFTVDNLSYKGEKIKKILNSNNKTFMRNFLEKNKADIFFVILLLSISLLYNYHNILTHRPYSTHLWRQADCLSITMNYYMENRNFLEPAIHWVGEKDGKTVSECPLIYYSVAQLWKVFGYHEFIFRLINILIVFSGLFCLYKLIQIIISDSFWSFIITFLVFTSPILVYYSNNFTADAPAFGFVLTGSFFLWKGLNQQKKGWYYLSFLFFLLGGLIKISSLIIFIAILSIHIYLVLFSKKEKGQLYRWYNLIPYLIVLFVLFVWYSYAIHYNQKNISGIFLTGLYPIWDIDLITRKSIWSSFINDLVPAYFDKKALYLTLSLFITLFFFYRKMNKCLFFINVLVFLGVVSYILLFYKAFTVHDYYLTNLLIFIPLPFIAMLEMLKRNYSRIFKMLPLKIFVFCAVLLLIYETAVINRMKYSTSDWIVKTNFVVDKNAVDYWAWYHWDYANHLKAYETITPYLRSLGIERTDKVLSLPDRSINISLYFMDQKGFSGFGYADMTFDQRMNYYMNNDVQFLIIDSVLNKQDYLLPYLKHKIGDYQNLSVFDLK